MKLDRLNKLDTDALSQIDLERGLLVPTKNAKGILENLSKGIIWLSGRLALWNK